MASRDLIYLSATELGRRIQSGEVSPVEATAAYLDRIEEVEPKLNAFITVLGDESLESARQAEAEIASGNHRGPLHGVPVGVKDQIHTAGILTTSASKLRADFVPDEDATVVRNLKRAGAVIIGKLNMTELAFGDPITSAFGVTGNPWDPPRNPGTSSTGSGAATASFMCATSLGEDTGGSVRGPAANCGLAGLRPSWGRVSRYGVDGASWSLDTIGPVSRTVEDCAATIGAIAGYDPRDAYTWDTPVPDYVSTLGGGIRGLKVGLVKEFTDPEVSPATAATLDAISAATEVLTELGAEVQQVSLPLAPVAGLASRTISAVERGGLHPEWIRERADDFHPNIRVQLMTGELIPGTVYNKAQKMRSMIRAQTLEMLESVDVLLMPTSPAPAQVMDLTAGINSEREAASWLSDASFRGLFSMVSGPALSICCGFTTEDGVELPLAMQIAGKPFDEATLLRVAHTYEQATEWHTRRPPI